MSGHAAPFRPLDDALLALRLFLAAPAKLGGLCLRGGGPARELVIDHLHRSGISLRRMPAHIDDERLLGGIDIAASLSSGRTIHQKGLLREAAGEVLVVPLAERLSDATAGKVAHFMDSGSDKDGIGLVLLDDGIEPEDSAPRCLLERVAFHCDLTRVEGLEMAEVSAGPSVDRDRLEPLEEVQLAGIATTAAALGIASARPLLFAAETARLHAMLHDRTKAIAADLEAAARLVLAPRATQLPPIEQEPDSPQPEDTPSEGSGDDNSDPGDRPLDDVVLEAAAAAIPPDLLAQLSSGRAKRNAQGSGGGRKRKSALRGKPLSARPGTPRGGARLALIDTMRAAVPRQALRRRNAENDGLLQLRKEDLRIRRFEERAAKVTIFCVDASGSAAASRLAEAKGAVELMLAQAYSTRSEVALVAFRGTTAELILPPTRSLTRARRTLAELPGGGGTPLALGLQAARETAQAAEMRGRTPQLVILTDGRGNIAADGSAGRARATEDAEKAAKAIATAGIEALVIDISARTGPDASRLAQSMQARFLALPMADARKLHAAVTAAVTQRAA